MSGLTPDVNTKLPSAQEENKETTTAQQALSQPVQADITPEKQEGEDPNWKAFREIRKRERAEKEAAERRASEKEAEASALKAAMEAAFSKGNPQQQSNEYGGYTQTEESEEEKIARKVEEIIAKKEEQYRREAAQQEMQEYPHRVQQTYPDYNKVVSQENIDYLDYHYPEITGPLSKMREGFEKASSVYQVIKKLVPNHGDAKRDAAKADTNMQKPRSLSSPTLMQSGEASRSSQQDVEKSRAENWARMQRLIKGI